MKDLTDLLQEVHYQKHCILQGLSITGIQYDSRKVASGNLFVAVKGFQSDGHQYIKQALDNGASAILISEEQYCSADYPWILVEDSRLALAEISNAFYGHPSEKLKLIGVTGTNGKTTTTNLICNIIEAQGYKTGLIGTIHNRIGDKILEGSRTTPESLELQQMFAQMVEEGIGYAVMEVSSHALELHRVTCCDFDIAVFTNLTQDHLDFHPDMLSYFKAKARLFLDVPRQDKALAINADDEWGRRLLELCPSALSYGLGNALPGQRHLRGDLLSAGTDGCRLRMTLGKEEWELHSPLVGAFNASNLLAVQALALELGLKPEQLAALADFTGVCGRLERVPNPQGLHVFVDYAHTPDALINVLKALRGAGFRRIVAVFGCGGNRDRTKRPLMGQAVARYADVAVLTSDNPRFEDPEAILRDVLPGLADAQETIVEVDRRTATARGLALLGPDDALLIAGKGHEDYQIIQGVKHHYSDQEVVRELLGCA